MSCVVFGFVVVCGWFCLMLFDVWFCFVLVVRGWTLVCAGGGDGIVWCCLVVILVLIVFGLGCGCVCCWFGCVRC